MSEYICIYEHTIQVSDSDWRVKTEVVKIDPTTTIQEIAKYISNSNLKEVKIQMILKP